MKKALTLAGFCMLAFTATKAQQYTPFPTTDAEWTVYYLGTCNDSNPPDTAVIKYTFGGDTLINGFTYHKLSSTSIPSPEVFAIREENKKVYFYSNSPTAGGGDSVLYDFNVGAGDTAMEKFVVEGVDSIKTGTTYSRRLHFGTSVYSGTDEYWIEGIGSTVGPITNTIPLPTCGFHHYELICFKQAGVVKYLNPNFASCDATRPQSTTGISTTSRHSSLKIYPNPTLSKQFHVDNVDINEGLTVKVTDYTGKVIFTQKLNHINNTVTLPNPSLMYVLIIINKQGQAIESQKIINQ